MSHYETLEGISLRAQSQQVACQRTQFANAIPKLKNAHPFMKTKNLKVADSMRSASAILSVPITAVRRAKRAGCSAFSGSRVNLKLLSTWLEREARAQRRPKPAPGEPTPGELGAPAALRRLEVLEQETYQRFRAASSPDEREAARVEHLEYSESLRRHDLAISEHRRGAGELLPAAAIETFVTEWFHAFACDLRERLTRVAGEQMGLSWEVIRALLAAADDAMLRGAEYARRETSGKPGAALLIRAFAAGYEAPGSRIPPAELLAAQSEKSTKRKDQNHE